VTSPSAGDDWKLLDAAVGGDERAARELVRRHGGRLHACALRIVGDAGTAEEVVQDALTQLFLKAKTLRRDSRLSTWLYAVVVNRCRDTLRRSSFRLAMDVQPLTADMPAPLTDPHTALARREREAGVRCALEKLSPELREVVALRFASGLSYPEIADVLGCAEGTVASRLHRALARLGAQLRAIGFTQEEG
jgi:RNA polymerase sigma-70 factor, ECF subfamily